MSPTGSVDSAGALGSGGGGGSTKKKKKRKKVVAVENLQPPMYPEVLNIAEMKCTQMEKTKILRYKMQVGAKVKLKHREQTGVIKYVGEAVFVWGFVIGLELEKNWKGLHNGTVKGVKYFDGKKGKCLFVKPMSVVEVIKEKKTKGKKRKSVAFGETPGQLKERISRSQSLMVSQSEENDAIVRAMTTEMPIGSEQERVWNGKFRSRTELTRHNRLNIKRGDCVTLNKGERAIVHYIGTIPSSKGYVRFGVELLDGALGTCDGQSGGCQYFECAEKRGDFVSSDRIRKKVDYLKDHLEW